MRLFIKINFTELLTIFIIYLGIVLVTTTIAQFENEDIYTILRVPQILRLPSDIILPTQVLSTLC